MPDEYFRLLSVSSLSNCTKVAFADPRCVARMPAPAPKSDLIRYALLYHHGGLYMDADFVAVKADISDVRCKNHPKLYSAALLGVCIAVMSGHGSNSGVA